MALESRAVRWCLTPILVLASAGHSCEPPPKRQEHVEENPVVNAGDLGLMRPAHHTTLAPVSATVLLRWNMLETVGTEAHLE